MDRHSSWIGKRFGHLEVVDRTEDKIHPNGSKHIQYRCVCSCGNEVIRTKNKLSTSLKQKNSDLVSCGCKRSEIIQRRFESLEGKTFGRLTVLSSDGVHKNSSGTLAGTRWLCSCECGRITSVLRQHLVRGYIKSCGCLRSDVSKSSEQRAKITKPVEGRSYRSMHSYIQLKKGKASDYPCSNSSCNKRAVHWAYDGLDPDQVFEVPESRTHPYSYDLNHYTPMCSTCHNQYDHKMRAKIFENYEETIRDLKEEISRLQSLLVENE